MRGTPLALSRFRKDRSGFTLVEVMLASAILATLVFSVMALLQVHLVMMRKTLEHSIMLDFAQHYMEIVQGQDFEAITHVGNRPINLIYNGSGGMPDIRFPANSDFFSINTDDYILFHPELAMLSQRDPRMSVTITDNTRPGEPNVSVKLVRVQLDWLLPNSTTRRASLDFQTAIHQLFYYSVTAEE